MPRRPSQFHGFVGQKDRLSHANRLLQGAKARGQPFPHTLLNGPSGCGKTKLAQAFAAEYDTTCIEAHGQDDRPTLCSKIQKLEACDVLFIDEAHGLDKDAHELLYGVIDNLQIPTWAHRSANLPGTDCSQAQLDHPGNRSTRQAPRRPTQADAPDRLAASLHQGRDARDR